MNGVNTESYTFVAKLNWFSARKAHLVPNFGRNYECEQNRLLHLLNAMKCPLEYCCFLKKMGCRYTEYSQKKIFKIAPKSNKIHVELSLWHSHRNVTFCFACYVLFLSFPLGHQLSVNLYMTQVICAYN